MRTFGICNGKETEPLPLRVWVRFFKQSPEILLRKGLHLKRDRMDRASAFKIVDLG